MLANATTQGLFLYVIFTALATLLALGQALFIVRQPKMRGYWLFLGFLLSSAIWSTTVGIQVLGNTLEHHIFWSKLEYIGIAFLPVLWTLFVAKYTDSFRVLLKYSFSIFVIPTLTLALVWTNSAHKLVWSGFIWNDSGAFPVTSYEHGLWFSYVHLPFGYLLTILSGFMIIKAIARSHKEQRLGLYALGVAQLLPIIANVIYLVADYPLDFTPIGLAISSFTITWAFVFQDLHKRSLVAHHTVLNSIKDAVFVLNKDDELVDLNLSAKALLHEPLKLGKPIAEYLEPFGEAMLELEQKAWANEFAIQNRIYSFSLSRLSKPKHYALLVGRDVTEQKASDEKLEQQLSKLEAIVDMNEVFRQTDSFVAIHETLRRFVFAMTKAEFFALLAYNATIETLTFAVCEGRDKPLQKDLAGTIMPRGESLGWHAIDSNATVRFRRKTLNEQLPENCHSLSETAGIKDFIATPIRDKSGKIISVFVVNIQNAKENFEEADVAIVEAIAQACGSSLRRLSFLEEARRQASRYKTLFDDASRQARELELLNTVSSTVAKDLEPQRVIQKTVDAIASVTGYERVSLYLLIDGVLQLQYQLGYQNPSKQVALEEGLVGQAAYRAEAILVHDLATVPKHLSLSKDASSSLAVPLFQQADVVGVLSIETLTEHKLSDHDLVWIGQLARQVSIAIERAELHDELRTNEERSRLITDNMSDIISLHAADGSYEYVSPSCEAILGYSDTFLSGQHFTTLVHPEDLAFLHASVFSKLLKGEEVKPYQYRIKRASGEYIWVETDASSLKDKDGKLKGFVSSSRDISERKQLQEQMLEGALLYDSLTKLPNRTLFMDRLEQALKRQERNGQLFATVFIDLDRFKMVNDSLGHNFGDQLLIETSERLLKCVRAHDTVARLGGDEFALILNNVSQEMAEQMAERIISSLEKPFLINKHPVMASASIGISMSDLITDSDELLRTADLAMYHVKGNGRSGHAVFSTEMSQHAKESLALELDLRIALEKEEFVVHYQPVINLLSGRVSGFEALVRWQSPSRGLVAPNVFIPIAEEVGIIPAIDAFVLKEASQQVALWNQRFNLTEPLSLSVNLSTKNFILANLPERIESVLNSSSLPASLLKLEITESVLMENATIARDILTDLRAKGVTIQIDDFGTGYSSLSYLNKLPLQSLKIDRSFVMSLPGSQEENAIIASIAALANSLSLDIVAEGIETQEQLEHVKALNCQYGQGYFFSKPLAAVQIEATYFYKDKPSLTARAFKGAKVIA